MIFLLNAEEVSIKISYQGNSTLKDKISYKYGEISGKIDNNSVIKIDVIENEKLYLFNTIIGNFSYDYQDLITKKEIILFDKEFNAGPITVVGIREGSPNSNTTELNSNDRLQYDGGMFLDKITGFGSIKKSAAYGNDPVLRGFKNEQLNILLNGSECSIAACPNRMDPPTSHIPMHQIENIEVIKGPYGLRFGNSFGGSINFIPIDEFSIDYQNIVNGTLRTNYESNGNITKNNANLVYGNDKAFIGLYASFYQGGDYKSGNDSTVNAKFQKSGVGVNGGFKFGSNTIKAKGSFDKGTDADFPTLTMDLRNDETTMFDIEHKLTTEGETFKSLQTNLYYTYVDHLMNNFLRPASATSRAESPVNTKNFGGRTEALFNFATTHLYAGFDYKYENADGSRIREMVTTGKVFYDNIFQNSSIQKIASFAQLNYHDQIFNIVGAIRVEHNHANAANPDSLFMITKNALDIEDQINLSLSLGVNYFIDNNFNLGLWVGQSERSGSLSERYINYFPIGLDAYEIVGNPNINKERNFQVDFQAGYNSDLFDVKVNLFANSINNYISAVKESTLKPRMPTSPGVRRIANLGSATKYGFEFALSTELIYKIHTNLNLAYTYAELSDGEPMPEIMPLEIALNFYRKFMDNKLKTEIEIKYSGEQDRVSLQFGEIPTPDFYLINANIAYQLFKNMSLELGVNNLLNEPYYEHLNRLISGTKTRMYSPGTSIWGTLILNI